MNGVSRRRRGLLYIGSISVIFVMFMSVGIFRIFPVFPGYHEIIYSSPGSSIIISSGAWSAKPFTIDGDHKGWGILVEGVLLSHNFKVDQIVLEFGYAPLSLTNFMALNDTEKRDAFWGFSSGVTMDQSGTEYSTGFPGIGSIGEYVWAIRFIDLDNNSTVFETNFAVSLFTM